ncbi:hypothetical protein BH10BDE1_BH10BDE1_16800 [soil metagenome]
MKKLALCVLAVAASAVLYSNAAFASVVGHLSRMQVSHTDSSTYRVYGQVEDFCSGTMISPRLVLTAGHCVFDLETRKAIPVRKFTPGRNQNFEPYGSIDVVGVHVAREYTQGDTSRDIAVLVLKESVGIKTGWLEIAWDHSVLAPHNSALGGWSGPGSIVGYPGDKASKTMWLVACDFYVAQLTTQLPQYTCDTFGGMSGSALVAGNSRGQAMIFGVHTMGHGSFNSGMMLTGANKVFLQSVMKHYAL